MLEVRPQHSAERVRHHYTIAVAKHRQLVGRDLYPLGGHRVIGVGQLRVLHRNVQAPQLFCEPPQPVIVWPVMLETVKNQDARLSHRDIIVAG